MDWLAQPETWIAFATLVILELVLGVDNVIFISILVGKLPATQQAQARNLGLALAVISRILLLFSISWVIGLTAPLFTVLEYEISGRDIILILGGLFLLGKSTHEIHQKLEGAEGHASARVYPSFASIIFQILLLDVVDQLGIMVASVIIAAAIMIVSANAIGSFVDRHPTIKMLALSFLLLIGFTLIVEGLHQHIPKGYIYFAMAFSIFVELLNLRLRKKQVPVKLHEPYVAEPVKEVAKASS